MTTQTPFIAADPTRTAERVIRVHAAGQPNQPMVMISSTEATGLGTVRAVAPAEALLWADAAQQVIEEHLACDPAGRCTGCGQYDPCPQRAIAHAALLGLGILPRRHSRITVARLEPFNGFSPPQRPAGPGQPGLPATEPGQHRSRPACLSRHTPLNAER